MINELIIKSKKFLLRHPRPVGKQKAQQTRADRLPL